MSKTNINTAVLLLVAFVSIVSFILGVNYQALRGEVWGMNYGVLLARDVDVIGRNEEVGIHNTKYLIRAALLGNISYVERSHLMWLFNWNESKSNLCADAINVIKQYDNEGDFSSKMFEESIRKQKSDGLGVNKPGQ